MQQNNKMKYIYQFQLMLLGIVLMFSSCGGQSEKRVIEDERLASYMLAGIYTLTGYEGEVEGVTGLFESNLPDTLASDFLSQMQEGYTDLLIFPFKEGTPKSSILRELKNSWGINNKEELLATLEELKNGLHQAKFEKCLQAIKENGGENADINAIDCAKYGIDKEDAAFVIKNFDKISATGIKAWDYARYANNVNMAQGAGLLTDAECDELMKSLLATARAAYSDWKTYFADFDMGRRFWGGDESNAEMFSRNAALLGSDNAYLIYKYIPLQVTE